MPQRRKKPGHSPQPSRPDPAPTDPAAAPRRGQERLQRAAGAEPPTPPPPFESPSLDPAPDAVQVPAAGGEPRAGGMEGEGGDGAAAARPPDMPRGDTF